MDDIDVPRNKGGDLKVNNPDDESINKWKELGVSKMDSSSSGSEPETALSGSAKVSKRKSRVSKRTQTTFITADPTNFRQMVQQVTGMRFSNSQILKPEPQRPRNRLPAFDTSKFLLYQRQQNGMVGPNTSGSGPMTSNVNQKVLCQVDGCNLDLSDCEAYYRRHRVCVLHSKSPQVTIHGQNQRFCLPCSRFHFLEEFDGEKRSCRRHLRGLKRGSKPRADSLLHSGTFFSSCQEKLDDIMELQRKVEKNWEAMDNMAKHCVKHCALYPEGEWISKSSLISHWIKDHLVYSHDEGNFVLRSLTNAFLEENYVGNLVRLNREIHDILVNLLVPKMHPMFLKQGEFGKTESMKEEEWNAKEIYLMDDELYELPESPNCPSLTALYLQRNYDLTIIPPLFFDHMPVLQVLDLSHTSIKSLPESLPKLVALRKLILRGCQLFMELSPQVGELDNLEELDLEETQIICLPIEIGKLVKLKRLRASFYGDMNCSKKRLQSSTMIHTGVISNLFHLIELSIDVNPDDERWNATVEAIIEEVCSSKMLNTLSLYLPKFELLKKLGSTSLIYHPLSRFSFVVGHPKRRIISRVPDEVEAHFKECDKCLKFVNGRDIPDEIKEVLRHATAFYLEHNATAVNLSEFGIENMKKLKFCILAECNKMQTIIDGGELYEERSDTEEDQTEEVLGSLLYLGIYYMNNLRSISKGPIHKGCLLNLKLLRIHTCPKLSTIFSVDFLANLNDLEVLIIEDCPQVTCIVSQAPSHPASVNYLPSLRRILLLFLPELVSISSGLHIAPKLERIGFYYCPKLESLSTTELSSENLKVIKGERKWWDEALKWNESDWGCQPDHLNDIFFEIDEEKDLVTQLTEDGYFGELVEDRYLGELVKDGYFGESVEDGFFCHASEQVGVEGSVDWQRPGLHEDARKMNLEKFLMGRKSRVSSLAVTSDQVKASPMEQLPLLNL